MVASEKEYNADRSACTKDSRRIEDTEREEVRIQSANTQCVLHIASLLRNGDRSKGRGRPSGKGGVRRVGCKSICYKVVGYASMAAIAKDF